MLILKKISRRQNSMKNYPVGKELKQGSYSQVLLIQFTLIKKAQNYFINIYFGLHFYMPVYGAVHRSINNLKDIFMIFHGNVY